MVAVIVYEILKNAEAGIVRVGEWLFPPFKYNLIDPTHSTVYTCGTEGAKEGRHIPDLSTDPVRK